MPMTREEFVAVLAPAQLGFIIESIQLGLADYTNPLNYSATAKIAHTPSVRAQIRNAHIVYRAKELLNGQDGVGIVPRTSGQRLLFYVAENIRLSFKKLNTNLRSQNYPTKQAIAFNAQQWPSDLDYAAQPTKPEQLPLWSQDIVPQLTNLIGGYVYNQAETSFIAYVVCPDGERNVWDWPLTTHDIIELAHAENIAETEAVTKIRSRPIRIRPGASNTRKKSG